ncbi:hypothetical protein FA10DRAFT_54922 [Acaromyces ingoldii]|uniref:Uncharacterized protein n=1 Tax=Acaromyces ingoldii TaxID=215250 RepID=A0A316YAA9_9BASI|nr:hypothetical protein FA10DRAFT_54922 [Acaromyces ingoldii]PWN86597.1 hypothetical protein FA10DRAFT_54922 [Acaromyces ingoldii]
MTKVEVDSQRGRRATRKSGVHPSILRSTPRRTERWGWLARSFWMSRPSSGWRVALSIVMAATFDLVLRLAAELLPAQGEEKKRASRTARRGATTFALLATTLAAT